MKKVTKQQLFEHYLDAGVPEVYAAMAADENDGVSRVYAVASYTLTGSFLWRDSAMGEDFWYAIYKELRHAGK